MRQSFSSLTNRLLQMRKTAPEVSENQHERIERKFPNHCDTKKVAHIMRCKPPY